MLEQSDNFIASLVAAASNALAGNLDAAKRATVLVRASDPNFRIQNVNTACRTGSPRCWRDGKMPYVGLACPNNRKSLVR